MKAPIRCVHVLRFRRIVKSKKLGTKFLGVFGLDTGFRTVSEEMLNAAVPEAFYHHP